MEQHETLATELLKEVKAQSKRWFLCFIIMCILEAATIGIFIWYVSLPVEESTSTYEIQQESDNDSQNQIIGGDYNGEQSEN